MVVQYFGPQTQSCLLPLHPFGGHPVLLHVPIHMVILNIISSIGFIVSQQKFLENAPTFTINISSTNISSWIISCTLPYIIPHIQTIRKIPMDFHFSLKIPQFLRGIILKNTNHFLALFFKSYSTLLSSFESESSKISSFLVQSCLFYVM